MRARTAWTLALGLLGAAPLAAGAQQRPAAPAGVQWYTTLKDGLAEAQRTGRPILFLAAAASCGGIPGVW